MFKAERVSVLKELLKLFIPIGGAIIIIIFAALLFHKKTYIKNIKGQCFESVKFERQLIDSKIKNYIDELKIISGILLTELDHGGSEEDYKRVSKELIVFVDQRKCFLSLSYFNTKNMVELKINKKGFEYQKNISESDFIRSKKFLNNKTEIVFPRINFFTDKPKRLEHAYFSVVYPVLTPKKNKIGSIVLNIKANDLFKRVMNKTSRKNENFFISDKDGNSIFEYDELSETLPDKKIIRNLIRSFSKSKSGIKQSELNGNFLTISEIYPYKKDKPPQDILMAETLFLVSSINPEKLLPVWVNNWFAIVLIFTVILLIIHYLWAKSRVAEIIILKELEQNEKLLIKKREELNLFIKNVPAAVAMLDKKFCYVAASNRWYADFKIKEEDITGRSYFDVFFEIEGINDWNKIFEKCIRGEVVKREKESFIGFDKKEEWLQIEARPWTSNGDNPGGIIIFTKLITDRVKAEYLFNKEKTKTEKYLEVAKTMLLVLDINANVELINEKGCEITGYREEEIIGKSWIDLCIPPEQRDFVKVIFKDVVKGDISQFEFAESHIITKSGEFKLISWKNNVIRDENNEITAVISSGDDITRQKITSEKLRKSEIKFRNLADSIKDIFFALNKNFEITYWNKTAEILTGINSDLITGSIIYDFFDDLKNSVVDEKLMKVMETGEKDLIEIPYRFIDEKLFLEFTIYPSEDGLVVLVRDITIQKGFESEIFEQAQILDLIIEGVFTTDINGYINSVNIGFEKLFKLTQQRALGKNISSLCVSKDKTFFDNEILNQISFRKELFFEIDFKKSDKTLFTGYILFSAKFSKRGELDGMICSVIDITERKVFEDRLKDSEKRLNLAVTHAPFPLVIHADDGEIIYTSSRLYELSGYAFDSFKDIDELIKKAFVKNYHKVKEDIEKLYLIKDFKYQGEYEVLSANGEVFTWEFSSAALGKLPDGRSCILTMAVDLTDRIQAEKQIIELNKDLENRVKDRTLSLEKANDEIKKGIRRAGILKDVALAANSRKNPEDALKIALELISKFTDWPVGHVYLESVDNPWVMEPSNIWFLKDPKDFIEFKYVTMQMSFKKGVGLPGRIVKSGKPAWIENIWEDDNFHRSKLLMHEDIKGAFGFPVVVGERVVAVLEFFSKEIQKYDPELMELVSEIGVQIGYAVERQKVEIALKENESIFRGVFDQSSHLMGLLDTEGRILNANSMVRAVTGKKLEELLGKYIWEDENWGSDENIASLKKGVKKANYGKVVNFELARPDQVNNKIYIDFSLKPIKDENGNVIYILPEGKDITDRIKREEEIRKLALVAQKTINGVIITDKKGYIEWINEGFTKISGYSPEESYGRKPGAFLQGPETNEEIVNKIGKAVKEGKGIKEELINYHKSGKKYWIEMDIQPVFDSSGEIINFIAIESDITQRKEITAELENAKEKAEKASNAKSDFLANMSHEIRTPMNAIIGMSHLLKNTELNFKQIDLLNKIEVSGNSLLRIINDILDFSKIEAGKLQLEDTSFNFDEFLMNISGIMAVKAQQKGLDFYFKTDPEIPYTLIGDHFRLAQVLNNLLSNAIKFTSKGEVVLTTRCIDKLNGKVTLLFEVKDTGIGLSSDQAGKLFKAFSQADMSTTREFGGTGLGLVISLRLVKMMGGEKIDLKSEKGYGSCFSFRVVFDYTGENRTQKIFLDYDLRDLEILVCDKNNTSFEVIEEILKSFLFKVKKDEKGEEAFDILLNNKNEVPYQVILIDWEIFKEIKDKILNQDIPVILMVPLLNKSEIIKETESIKSYNILVKPFGRSVLFNTIMKSLGKNIGEYKKEEKVNKQDQRVIKSLKGVKVLLAEDNELNQEVAIGLLDQAGIITDTAVNGVEAIQKIKDNYYDLVLMDIQMPEMDGLHAAKKIRSLSGGKSSIPLIAMTAHAMEGDKDNAIKIGMDDYVTKPINPSNLFNTIAKVLNRDKNQETANTKLDGEEKLWQSLKGFDTSLLKTAFQGEFDKARELLFKYLESYSGYVKKIKEAIYSGNKEDVKGLIHAIKGVSGNIGANKIFNNAEKLERAIKEGNGVKIDDLMKEFELSVEEIMSVIKSMKDKPGFIKEININDFKTLFLKIDYLKDAYEKSDVSSVEKTYEFMQLLKNSKYNKDVTDLYNFISKYRFKDALKLLLKLEKKISDNKNERTK